MARAEAGGAPSQEAAGATASHHHAEHEARWRASRVDAPHARASEAASELAALAAREAQVRSELTAGLRGAERQAGQRALSAAHDAFVGVALKACAPPEERQQAVRQAAGKLSKAANDGEKKRKRDEVSREMKEAKAARLHKATSGHGGNRRDRRDFANRASIRKRHRVANDARQPMGRAPGGKGGKGGKGRKGGKGGRGRGGGRGGR